MPTRSTTRFMNHEFWFCQPPAGSAPRSSAAAETYRRLQIQPSEDRFGAMPEGVEESLVADGPKRLRKARLANFDRRIARFCRPTNLAGWFRVWSARRRILRDLDEDIDGRLFVAN
ncbi:MAG: hypothetical protein AAF585_18945 [Verrucomicrobiota bacterium]